MKLLLVEDDEFSRDMLAQRLTHCGYEVITAGNGRVALTAAREHRPDLILLDLDMAVMDGRSALRSLKDDPRTFRIPVIALASRSSIDDVRQAAAEGCQGCEVKPVVLRRLLLRIEGALTRKTESSELRPRPIGLPAFLPRPLPQDPSAPAEPGDPDRGP